MFSTCLALLPSDDDTGVPAVAASSGVATAATSAATAATPVAIGVEGGASVVVALFAVTAASTGVVLVVEDSEVERSTKVTGTVEGVDDDEDGDGGDWILLFAKAAVRVCAHDGTSPAVPPPPPPPTEGPLLGLFTPMAGLPPPPLRLTPPLAARAFFFSKVSNALSSAFCFLARSLAFTSGSALAALRSACARFRRASRFGKEAPTGGDDDEVKGGSSS
mmetsp:Transcript_26787/g.54851  ORF Transcript_26787/g.54851 Transcript_26787/m.54851 type:complete len:220 (+) Transcript_26787:734-1393(+)